MQPINYQAQQPDIGNSFAEGVQMGNIIRQQRMLRQQEAEAEAYKAELNKVMSSNDPRGFIQLAAKYPKHGAGLKQAWEMQSEEQRKSEFGAARDIFYSIQEGRPDVALGVVDQQIEALKNSGKDTRELERIRVGIERNPAQAAQYVGAFMSSVAPKEYAETLAKFGGERRADAEAPLVIREKTAKAGTAESEQIIKEAEAKFAPEKVATMLGLDKARIEQARAAAVASRAAAGASSASAEKTRADAAKSRASAQQIIAGIIPQEQRPEMESKFRKEYVDNTKVFQDVRNSYGRITGSEDSAVGDLSLIFGYMKMLDPGSVVREGEFANAQNAAGVPDRVANLYNRIMAGERLNESQRKAFKGQAKTLYKKAEDQEKIVRSGIERIAKGYGLNTNNIFYETGGAAEPTEQKKPVDSIPGQAPVPGTILRFDAQGNPVQ